MMMMGDCEEGDDVGNGDGGGGDYGHEDDGGGGANGCIIKMTWMVMPQLWALLIRVCFVAFSMGFYVPQLSSDILSLPWPL
jgi:hypothetical protein